MRSKISLLLLLFMTGVLLCSGMLSYFTLRDTLEEQFAHRKNEVGKRLQVSIGTSVWLLDKVTAASILDGELASPEVRSIQAFLLAKGQSPSLFVSRERSPNGVIDNGSEKEISDPDVLRLPLYDSTADYSNISANKSAEVGYILVSYSRHWVDQFLGKLLFNRFVEIGVLNLTLGIVLYLVLSRMVINPLAELSHAFKTLAENPQGGEIKIEQKDEFGQVVDAYNQIERRLVSDLARRREAEENLKASNDQLIEALDNLKLMQDSLIQSEKFASLGSLVAGVAHEINTPVGVAVTAASFLAEETQKVDGLMKSGGIRKSEMMLFINAALEGSQLILQNAERAAHLINSFKQVAADEMSEERRSFNLYKYMDEVLTSLRPKYKNTKIFVSYTCPADLEMDTYPGLLAQVLTNLITNALVHGFDEGDVGEVTTKVTSEDSWINIECFNNGKKIPQEVLGKVFEPFFTTKRGKGGTGLGLNIVFNIVTQRLGGTIRAFSDYEHGTRFIVRIPQVLGAKPA